MQKQVDFSEAKNKKYPEQVVIVIAKDADGRANPITLCWAMFASGKPPMMAVAIAKKHYSVECIDHSKCFTVSYPNSDMADTTLFYGKNSGRNIDKFKKMQSKIEPAAVINSLLLSDAVANFECELISKTDAGDHFIYLGEIVASHINTDDMKRLFCVAAGHKLGPVTAQ